MSDIAGRTSRLESRAENNLLSNISFLGIRRSGENISVLVLGAAGSCRQWLADCIAIRGGERRHGCIASGKHSASKLFSTSYNGNSKPLLRVSRACRG